MGIEDALKLYSMVSQVGFPGILFLLLVGSYFRIWRWGKDYVDLETRSEKQIAKLEEMNADLRQIARKGFDVVEVQGHAIRSKDRARIEELNRHLRE